MSVEIISLSHPITLHDPNPPAIPAPEISQLYSIAADGANVFILKIALHSGTHVDAPAHVVDGGLQRVILAPWQVAGVDSTPCTVFGERRID